MTRLLAIDTSSTWCSVALFSDDEEPIFRHEQLAASASQYLLPWIQEILLEKNIQLHELDGIGVGVGPGAFTVVRLSIAVAQGLAYAAKIPVFPVISLDAIAMQSIQKPAFLKYKPERFLVCIDARMEEVYWAVYEMIIFNAKETPRRIGGIHLTKPENLDLNGVDFLVGNGAAAYKDRILLSSAAPFPRENIDTDVNIHSLGILLCALDMLKNGQQQDVHDLEPVYVRNKVARTVLERA